MATNKNKVSNTRRARRALGTAVAVMVAVLGLGLAALALLARTDSAGVTRIAGQPVLTVLSDSMTPTFTAGDLLIEKPVGDRAAKLPVGTVITFRAHNGLVSHRIVEVDAVPGGGVAYRTRGDANNMVDETPVASDDVVGVYSERIPKAGYVLNAVHTPQGLFVLIFGIALFAILPTLAKWWRAAGQQTNRDEDAEALQPAGVS